MNRDELLDLIRGRDALAAAVHSATGEVTFTRAPASPELFADVDAEGDVADHRAAHDAGRPSDAIVLYGEGVSPEHVADRLLALAVLAEDTGLLRAVCPVPVPGVTTPGSWGVEDLTVIAAARRALSPSVRVRPSWDRLGPQTCGVTLAFGADDLAVPADDPTDISLLAAAVGRTAVER